MKLGIIFGSGSTECDVSIVSASSIIKNLNKGKYDIYPIYLDQNNDWYELLDDVKTIDIYEIGNKPKNIKKIENVISYLQKLDVVLPVMHGAYGEDGSIQGMFKLLNIPYVGCDILASSVCMDKFYTKFLLKNAGIMVSDDINIWGNTQEKYYIDENFNKELVSDETIINLVQEKLKYPVFVKPANSGSSVGVTKATNGIELIDAINEAFKYDRKVLIEKGIKGRELECAVLNGKATSIGEVHASGTFYSYDSKYKNAESFTSIPAEIDKMIESKIKEIAEKAFLVVDGKNLARVDFFLEEGTNNIILNEINTMPGFTTISMYPKLVENSGISYSELLDILISSAK